MFDDLTAKFAALKALYVCQVGGRNVIPALVDLAQAADALWIAARNGALDGPEDVEFEQYEAARSRVAAGLEGGK